MRGIVTFEEVEAESSTTAEAQETVVALYAQLKKLDDDVRLAFILRYVQEMTLPEVARCLGLSLATAKRRLVVEEALSAFGEEHGGG